MTNRFDYISRSLSRTNRKDAENYVLNAIWNRLTPHTREILKPVTQQPVKHNDRQYYIDLYFPQLNIGVECDESHHVTQATADKIREENISSALDPVENPDIFTTINSVNANSCEFLRVAVPAGKDQARLAQVDEAIDEVVERIQQQIELQQKSSPSSFVPWNELALLSDPEAFYRDRKFFDVADGTQFRRIVEVCNILLGCSYNTIRRGYFTPKGMAMTHGSPADYSNYKVWFPKLSAATNASFLWKNTLSSDGQEIIVRRQDDNPSYEAPKPTQNVTFAKTVHPVTREVFYQFVGVFLLTNIDEGGTLQRYSKVASSFPILPSASSS